MSLPLLGMDVGFYSHIGAYPLAARCEMLAELGYAAVDLSVWSEPAWADLPILWTAAAASGLAVAAVYATVDLAAPHDSGENGRILGMIDGLPAGATVELSMRFDGDSPALSDPSGDDAAARFLDLALERAERSDVTILLYPHTFFWMQRVADAVRLCARYSSPRLGMVFPLFHWYAVDGVDLPGRLAAAAPYLRLVNTNGSRRLNGQYFPVTIEPVGTGDFDNFAFLGMLRAIGYEGFLGIQSYGIGGDSYSHFRQSIAAVRDIEQRLDRAPHWAALRPDHL